MAAAQAVAARDEGVILATSAARLLICCTLPANLWGVLGGLWDGC